MARFTDELKWSDKWFRSLSPNQKLVWLFLCDNCDIAGFYEIDEAYISFISKIPKEEVITSIEGLSSRLDIIEDIAWIRGFLKFQKNIPLNPLNNAHKKIIGIIRSHPNFADAQDLLDTCSEDGVRVCLTQKEAVWIRDRGICQYTNEKIDFLYNYELDHINPRANGGGDTYSNLACCNKAFNRFKSDSDISIKVADYSASQAKKDLLKDPTLIDDFNSFFDRNIIINNKGRLVEDANGYLGPKTPLIRGVGKGKGKGNKEEGLLREKQLFDDFRVHYPGTKKGLDTEFQNFKKKHKDWKTVLPDLLALLKCQINQRNMLKASGQFVPEWKHLSTWINQRCWEEEFQPAFAEPKRYRP